MNRKAAWKRLLVLGFGTMAIVPLAPAQPAQLPQFDRSPSAQAAAAIAWPTRVGRLAETQGVVWFYDRDEGAWTQAVPNRPLTSGDRISTERGARATLRIGSTTLRLNGQSDLGLRRIDDQAIALDLEAGSLSLRIASREVLSELEVITPEGRFVPRSIGHFRIDRRGNDSEGSAWRGQLRFDASDSQLEVAAGQHAQLWVQGNPPATHYRLLPLDRDDFANWVTRADVDASRSETARWVSPEMTGAEDLDRYGRWTQSPDYGSVWVPSDVPSGWVPYQDGRWVWVSPWGWTWMDSAPWGFAPFHYGRWVQWGGRWAWSPGAREIRPVYAPAVVHWTPAPQHEWRNNRPPPPSAWVPVQPREVYRPPVHAVVPQPPHDRTVPRPPSRGDEPGRRPGERPIDRSPGARPDLSPTPQPQPTPQPARPPMVAQPPFVAPVVPPPQAPIVRTPPVHGARPVAPTPPAPNPVTTPTPVTPAAPVAPVAPRPQLPAPSPPLAPQPVSRIGPASSPPAVALPANPHRPEGPRNDRGRVEQKPPAAPPSPAPVAAPTPAPAPVPAPSPENEKRRRPPEQNDRQRERSNVLGA